MPGKRTRGPKNLWKLDPVRAPPSETPAGVSSTGGQAAKPSTGFSLRARRACEQLATDAHQFPLTRTHLESLGAMSSAGYEFDRGTRVPSSLDGCGGIGLGDRRDLILAGSGPGSVANGFADD